VITLLENEVSQHEISRKSGIVTLPRFHVQQAYAARRLFSNAAGDQ